MLVSLLLLTGALAFFWYQTKQHMVAPVVKGYNWPQHPKTLLIAYKSDCCGMPVSEWILAGMDHQLDVLIVTPQRDDSLRAMEKQFSPQHFKISVDTSQKVARRFSPHGMTGNVLIENGIVVRHLEGGTPTDTFFQGR